MAIRKRFDKQLYDKVDNLARKAVKTLFKGFTGWTIKDNPSKTGVDLFVYKNGNHVCNIEAEVKMVWNGNKFPYDSLHIPERKGRYKKLPIQTLFIVFNNDCSSFLVIFGKDLYKAKLIEVPNRYVFKGEKFFSVSLKKAVKDSIRTVLVEIQNGADDHRQFIKSSTSCIDEGEGNKANLKSKRQNKRTGVKICQRI